MCKVLMSINPEHVDNILSGAKRFEFRKIKCREKIDTIVIYSTAPVMRIVAEVEVEDIIEDTPQEVWNMTKSAAGVDKMFFDQYYDGRDRAIAYALGKVNRFSIPKYLADYGVRVAPQSYVYVR